MVFEYKNLWMDECSMVCLLFICEYGVWLVFLSWILQGFLVVCSLVSNSVWLLFSWLVYMLNWWFEQMVVSGLFQGVMVLLVKIVSFVGVLSFVCEMLSDVVVFGEKFMRYGVLIGFEGMGMGGRCVRKCLLSVEKLVVVVGWLGQLKGLVRELLGKVVGEEVIGWGGRVGG